MTAKPKTNYEFRDVSGKLVKTIPLAREASAAQYAQKMGYTYVAAGSAQEKSTEVTAPAAKKEVTKPAGASTDPTVWLKPKEKADEPVYAAPKEDLEGTKATITPRVMRESKAPDCCGQKMATLMTIGRYLCIRCNKEVAFP